jgi:hypothetical protein
LYYTGGFSDYDGLNVSYRGRAANNIQFTAAYTLSKVEGNTLPGSDNFTIGAPGQCTHCPYDFRILPGDDPRMAGPLIPDSRHKVVLSGIFDLPWDIRFSGFFRANSSKPFNAFSTNDLNGDGFRYDSPDEHVNARRGEPFSQLDIRVNKIFNIRDVVRVEGIFEVFNLFNAENPAAIRRSGNQSEINGVLETPTFGQATTFAGDPFQGEQRLAQIGFRIEF